MEGHLEAIVNLLKWIIVILIYGQAFSIIFEIKRERQIKK